MLNGNSEIFGVGA